MPALLRHPAASPWALALGFALVVLLAGSRDVFWTGDFYLEAYTAYEALMRGDSGRFFEVMPGYSGFVVVDFKTDAPDEDVLERYRLQVALYARAIQLATGESVRAVLMTM